MDITLFQDMGTKINEIVTTAITALSQGWAAGLLTTTSVGITCYVMFYGYMVLAGKVQAPVPELVWSLARFAIVIGILNNIGTYESLMTEAVHGLRGFLVGNDGTNAYSGIDKKINSVVNLYIDVWKPVGSWSVGNALFAVLQSLFLLPLCLGVVGYAVGIITSEITLIGLLAVFPLFLFCYLWGWFKNMFSMWLQAVMGSCLFILFLSIFSQVGFEIAKYTNIWVASHSGAEVFLACVMYLIAGLVTIMGTKLAGQLASALSQVGIDRVNASMSNNALDTANKYRQSKQAQSQSLASNANLAKLISQEAKGGGE